MLLFILTVIAPGLTVTFRTARAARRTPGEIVGADHVRLNDARSSAIERLFDSNTKKETRHRLAGAPINTKGENAEDEIETAKS